MPQVQGTFVLQGSNDPAVRCADTAMRAGSNHATLSMQPTSPAVDDRGIEEAGDRERVS